MEKCDCYHERIINNPPKSIIVNNQFCNTYGHIAVIGECWGTKECEPCTCGGDTSKCNFYPEKRNGSKMTTAEMWVKAQKNNKAYKTENMAYSKKYGFTAKDNFQVKIQAYKFYTIDDIMNIDGWEEMPDVMTKEEAEKKFNIHII